MGLILISLILVSYFSITLGVRYTFTDNSMAVGTCVWADLNGNTVAAWDREVGQSYICGTTSKPNTVGSVSTGDDGMCQYYCRASDLSPGMRLFGISVHTAEVYSPSTLPNPYMDAPPPCLRIDHKCTDEIETSLPMNNLSIALHGTPEFKRCMFDNVPCNASIQCAACEMLHGIYQNQYPSETAVLKLRGTGYACLLTYLGIGSIQEDSKCWDQLGDHCTAFAGMTPYCFNNQRKIKGITNYGTNDGPSETWCYYANWAQYRDVPYKTSPNAPPSALGNCDGIIYAFATILEVGSTKAPLANWPGYNAGDMVCSEFEWNDNVQMPAVTALDVKVLLSIGGWTMGIVPFQKAANSEQSRSKFVSSCIQLMKKYGFSGIDVDWEAPNHRGGVPADIPLYGLLAKKFREEIDRASAADSIQYYFTTAVMVGFPINSYYEMETNHVYFDKIFLMAYDLHGAWDSEKRLCQTAWNIGTECGLNGVSCANPVDYFYLDYAVGFYADIVPIHKLGMGLGFYGRGWQKTGGVGDWEPIAKKHSPQLKEDGVMGYAEIVDLYRLECDLDPTQMCCMNTFTIGSDTIYLGWDSVETMILKINAAFRKYGIKTYFSWAWDYDSLPGAEAHNRVIEHVKNLRQLTPKLGQSTYQIGTGPLVKCGGIQAVVNDIAISSVSYTEFYALKGFGGIVAAPVSTITSCTQGAAKSTIHALQATAPSNGVNINTFLPSTDLGHYLIGFADGKFAQYSPKVQRACQDLNSDVNTSLSYIEIDKSLYFAEPIIKEGFVLAPMGLHYIMDDFRFTVDYINFETACMSYQIDNIPLCITVACGGRPDCITKYASICNEASAIILNAKRSNLLIADAFAELELERTKAMVYASAGTSTETDTKILGAIAIPIAIAAGAVAAAALAVSLGISDKVDALAARQDATRDAVVGLGDKLVVISKKLDRNIHAVNERVSDLEGKVNERFEVINKNFKTLAEGLKKVADVSQERFAVTLGYMSWYQQLVGLTDQLTQGAIQMNHKVTMTKLCIQGLETGSMINCPSDVDPFMKHPGLRSTQTVKALRYHNKKLIIVNSVPFKLKPITPAKAFAMPIMRLGEVCWPDYNLFWVNGKVTGNLECVGRYCYEPELPEDWTACSKNFTACKFVCGECYRGVCYDSVTKKLTFTGRGEITVNFNVVTVPEFNPVVGGINTTAIIKPIVLGVLETIKDINTSATLLNITQDIQDIQDILDTYQELYNSITFGGKFPVQTIMWIVGVTIAILVGLVSLYIIKGVFGCMCRSKGSSSGPYKSLNQNDW